MSEWSYLTLQSGVVLVTSSRLELPHARDVEQKLSSTPNCSLCFPSLFFSLFTNVLLRDERCFPFFGTFWPSRWVCGFLRNGVSEQLLGADPGSQPMSLKSLSITPVAFPSEAGQLSVSWNDTFFSALSVLKYQVSKLIGSR